MAIFINKGRNSNPLGPITGILLLVFAFIILFYVAKGIFTILSWLAPIMLVMTLILDYRVVTNYLKFLWDKLKTDSLFGLVMVLITIFGFPVVSGYLLFKAYMKKLAKDRVGQFEEETYSDYEIVEEVEVEETLELKEIEDIVKKSSSSEYDNYFE